jgi:hypothetical protein
MSVATGWRGRKSRAPQVSEKGSCEGTTRPG